MNTPLVSIVTPSFNQARYLEATIRSVLDQDYPNLEYLIVDGGSTDGSVEIIKKFVMDSGSLLPSARQQASRIHTISDWVSEKDKGQTDAINKGFARAKGNILAWLNSDDTYEPGAVSAAVKFFEAHPEAGLVYGDANFIDEQGRVIGRFAARQTDYTRLRRGYVHIPQQAAFFRADLWREVGPLDPSFYFAMDYDLWVRIAARAPIHYTPQLWANFRLHSSGKTIAADDRCWPEMIRIHRRDGGNWLSFIVAKYYVRKVAAPLLNWRRRLQMRQYSR
jgi:glycosyltransferase involved in cell wall biosynthesis